MPPLIGRVSNMDANEVAFFSGQLEYLKKREYNVKYGSLQATQIFPVSTEAGPGAETIVYDQFDTVGVMKFISDYADDLPRSDVKGKQFSIIIQSLGGSWGYSIQEIRNAQYARRNLSSMRANAARRSNDQMVNKIAWNADGSSEWAGLTGILNHPNVTKAAATTGGWDSGATPDEIIVDVNEAINSVPDLTNGQEWIDRVAMPNAKYAHLASTPRSATSDTTILEFLRRVHPGVRFFPINELKNVVNPRTGSGTTNVALYYRADPDALQLEIPVIYESFPAQERNLSYVVPVHSRIAGFNVYYPLSVYVQDGI